MLSASKTKHHQFLDDLLLIFLLSFVFLLFFFSLFNPFIQRLQSFISSVVRSSFMSEYDCAARDAPDLASIKT